MDKLLFLHSYGEQPMGEDLPSLTISVTRDGKTGMSGEKLARLLRCSPHDLHTLIYRPSAKNSDFNAKNQAGRGFTPPPNYRIPPGCKGTSAGLPLFPSELIGPAANQRQLHLARKGIEHPPLTAFIEYCIVRTLDLAIKDALGWRGSATLGVSRSAHDY